MIDEIDKMGADFRGDPASAMLEVLDPEQNATFRDHYLDVPFDLSRRDVHHAPRTTLDTIPGPLRDRMEIIQLAGYTEEEKLADRQALPRAAPDRAQRPARVADRVRRRRRCAAIIADYTREAGVRELEREIGDDLPQGRARRSPRATRSASVSSHREPSGARAARASRASTPRSSAAHGEPGVATGLAWTPVGGDVLFVEATAMPGNGQAARSPASSAT